MYSPRYSYMVHIWDLVWVSKSELVSVSSSCIQWFSHGSRSWGILCDSVIELFILLISVLQRRIPCRDLFSANRSNGSHLTDLKISRWDTFNRRIFSCICLLLGAVVHIHVGRWFPSIRFIWVMYLSSHEGHPFTSSVNRRSLIDYVKMTYI